MIKKYKGIISSIILVIAILIVSQVTYTIDKRLIEENKEPKFVIKTDMVKDGGTTIYKGLGYQVVRWNRFLEDGI
ncbi:hypothetical protein [Clostridium sp. LP20]|uniref:hypothetical protein n=1 Tax=Clostridium sp. LP20 TaxID=3418665 RepID=UPI003EE55017